jgi:hypothetical protein
MLASPIVTESPGRTSVGMRGATVTPLIADPFALPRSSKIIPSGAAVSVACRRETPPPSI